MNLAAMLEHLYEAGTIPVLVGPTASGKTALAIRLAAHFGGALELVSADAFQVYRGMDIGTAKASVAERERVRHHLVDICDPEERYTAGRFAADATAAIGGILSRGARPLVVGGSGLYLSALIYGLHEAPQGEPDPFPGGTREALLEELAARDPVGASRLAEAPRTRIARALSIVLGTGRTLDAVRAGDRPTSGYRFRILQLVQDRRGVLYPRINERVARMFACGLVAEVEGLRARGIGPALPSQRAIGYREVHGMLDGAFDRAEALRRIQVNTRRYAKRQETWFRTQYAPGDVVRIPADECIPRAED